MQEQRLGQVVSLETRRESYEKVDKQKRYDQILEILKEEGKASASQISLKLYLKGYTYTTERNTSAPRLTELCIKGIVEEVGKEKDEVTNRNVTVYKIKEEQ